MTNQEIVKKYIPMVDFISAILGDNCEVVLHDLTTPETSIIAIRNGHLSGRKLGGPLTDLVLKVIQNKSYKDKDFVSNYKATGKTRKFRSASYFIKNDAGEIVGVLCVNIDVEPYLKVKDLMEKLSLVSLGFSENAIEQPEKDNDVSVEEQLHGSVEDLLNTMIQEVITEKSIPPQRMSIEEKIEVVKCLNNKGTFHLKGAVSEVARALEVSEPTVYRYLNKLRE